MAVVMQVLLFVSSSDSEAHALNTARVARCSQQFSFVVGVIVIVAFIDVVIFVVVVVIAVIIVVVISIVIIVAVSIRCC